MHAFCRTLPFTALLTLALSATAAAPVATIPASTGTALDGRTISLPRDLPGRATVLILGFSRNSADFTTAWEKPVRTTLAVNPSIGFYDIPFLEDAPSFIRPFILRSIRKQVPDALKPNFVPLTSGQSSWKHLTGFTSAAPDAAYILLVDHSGQVLWQTHDPFTPARFEELASAARRLAADPK
jgi:hypothetical protein